MRIRGSSHISFTINVNARIFADFQTLTELDYTPFISAATKFNDVQIIHLKYIMTFSNLIEKKNPNPPKNSTLSLKFRSTKINYKFNYRSLIPIYLYTQIENANCLLK